MSPSSRERRRDGHRAVASRSLITVPANRGVEVRVGDAVADVSHSLASWSWGSRGGTAR